MRRTWRRTASGIIGAALMLTTLVEHALAEDFPHVRAVDSAIRSIHDVPNLSRSIAKREAKKVSCIGMKIFLVLLAAVALGV